MVRDQAPARSRRPVIARAQAQILRRRSKGRNAEQSHAAIAREREVAIYAETGSAFPWPPEQALAGIHSGLQLV